MICLPQPHFCVGVHRFDQRAVTRARKGVSKFCCLHGCQFGLGIQVGCSFLSFFLSSTKSKMETDIKETQQVEIYHPSHKKSQENWIKITASVARP